MTEVDWDTWTDPAEMLRFLAPTSDRKLRLAVIEFLWEHADVLSDQRSRAAFTFLERIAEGLVTEAEREASQVSLWNVDDDITGDEYGYDFSAFSGHPELFDRHFTVETTVAILIANQRPLRFLTFDLPDGDVELFAEQADIVRDIFGNPFRPFPAVNPAWRTETVRDVAAAIYAHRTFGNLPVIADALLDAGCEDPALLTHFRGTGPHVRGCWALDLILGKS